MKKVISMLLIIVCFVLVSCGDAEPSVNPPEDTYEASVEGLIAYSESVKLTLDHYSNPMAFECFALAKNTSSQTKELISLQIDWLDSNNNILLTTQNAIPRLEPGEIAPVWEAVFPDEDEFALLSECTSIKVTFLSCYKDLGFRTTKLTVSGAIAYQQAGLTRVTGIVTNNSGVAVKEVFVRAMVLDALGTCRDHGSQMILSVLNPGLSTSFDFLLEPDASVVWYCSGVVVK